jgi:hypothetical protein
MTTPRFPEPADDDWQPATSRPGELYTYEGQVRSAGAFARGMTNHDPRLRRYRRSMWWAASAVLAIGLGAIAIVVIVVSLAQ